MTKAVQELSKEHIAKVRKKKYSR